MKATVNGRYPRRLRARMVGANGQPIEGVSVTFTIVKAADGAGASFPDGGLQASGTTNSAGWASSPPLVADSTAGRFTAAASSPGSKAITYRLRNVAGRPASVVPGAAPGESTPVGTRFAVPLAVTVTDADDNPVAGAIVVFRAPARGPSGTFGTGRRKRTARVRTDAKGIAVAPAFTANGQPGGYVVTASVAGSRRRTAFGLVNSRR